MSTWFNITAKSGAGAIAIYDEIGSFGVSAGNFNKQLDALGSVSRIDLSINSPGGSVFDGFAIYNMLKRHRAKVYVTVDGVAASIASVVAMAGDQITMPANAFLMIHSASGVVIGSAEDMRKMAADLEQINKSIVGIYSARTGIPVAEIEEMLKADTWIPAAVAVERGFADKLLPEKRMAAKFDLKAKLPTAPASLLKATAPAPVIDKEALGQEMDARYRAFMRSHPLAASRIVAAFQRSGDNSADYNTVFQDIWNSAQLQEARPDMIPGTPEAKAAEWKLSHQPLRPVSSWSKVTDNFNRRPG